MPDGSISVTNNRKITKNKNSKTVSVCFSIDFYPLRLSGTREKWENLHSSFGSSVAYSIEQIEEVIPSPIDAEKVRAMYTLDPEGVSFQVYYYFVQPAMCEIITKPRGGSPYLRDDLGEVRRVAKWVYAFLLNWLKKSKDERPAELNKYCSNSHIGRLSPSNREAPKIARELTMEIIDKYFKIGLTKQDHNMFYNHYICHGPGNLTSIKAYLSGISNLPSRPPLSEIFHPVP
jgi:hypothetical protein